MPLTMKNITSLNDSKLANPEVMNAATNHAFAISKKNEEKSLNNIESDSNLIDFMITTHKSMSMIPCFSKYRDIKCV